MPFRFDPKHWRDRAEGMRRLAQDAKNEELRLMMLRIAADYDELATKPENAAPTLSAKYSN